MQLIVYGLIVSLFSVDWLAKKHNLLPDSLTYLPELFAAVFALAIVVEATRTKTISAPRSTLLLVSLLVLILVGTAILSQPSPTVLMNGLRAHLKFLPFLILPFFFTFSEQQISRQFYLLLGLSFVQLPVALVQRFVLYGDMISGDWVGGTLGDRTSGVLSVWLACAIAMCFSRYLNGQLRLRTLIVIAIILVTPMTLNLTKISFILFPLAIMVPASIYAVRKKNYRQLLFAVLMLFAALAIETVTYDYLYPKKISVIEWFLTDDAKDYLYQGTTTGGGSHADVKRIDAVRIAVQRLNYENALLLGLGIGNVSPAANVELQGEYWSRYEHYLPRRVWISYALWETGIVGTVLLMLLIGNVGWVAYRFIGRASDGFRAYATGWTAISAIMLICLIYLPIFIFNVYACLFWFYSGVLVAESHRQRELPGEMPDAGLRQAATGIFR